MDLVVDANVLFAALLGRDKTMELFFEDKIRLFAPSHLLFEFENNKEWLAKSCKLPVGEFIKLFESLKNRIDIYTTSGISSEIAERAERLAPHRKDIPYFALALYLGCAIWSREGSFKKQNAVKVYSTPELVDRFLTK